MVVVGGGLEPHLVLVGETQRNPASFAVEDLETPAPLLAAWACREDPGLFRGAGWATNWVVEEADEATPVCGQARQEPVLT